MKYKRYRHSRERGKPLPDAWQVMFYQGLSCFDLDSRIRGNDGAAFFQSIDDTP